MVGSRLGDGDVRVLKQESLRDAVIEEVRSLYLSGKIKSGERLPSEAELAQQLGVGRSSIREAVTTLQVWGILDVRHGVGTFVSTGSSSRLLEPVRWSRGTAHSLLEDLVDARLAVDVKLVALATERASDEELSSVEAACEQRRIAVKDQVSLGYDFHLAIADAAKSPVLRLMLACTANLYHETIGEFEHGAQELQQEFFNRQQDGHDQVLTAMKGRDAEGAQQAMRDHLFESLRYYSLLTAST